MIIYAIIFSLIFFLSQKNFNKINNFFRILSMGILVAFIGLRFGVGVDYFSYQDMFLEGDLSTWVEPGYFYLMKFVHLLNGEFYWVTSIVAFITISFLYKGVTNLTPYFALSIFFFLVSPSGYGFCVNGMRQGITAAIFLYSIKYIIEGQFYRYCTILLVGSLFHVSLLILIPFYFIRKIKFRKNLYLLLVIVVIVLNQVNVFENVLLKALSYTPWAFYLEVSGILGAAKTSSGLGFIFTNLVGLAVIYFIPERLVRQQKYAVIFNFYVIFLIFRNVFFSILIIYRLVVYFEWVSFVALAIFLHQTFKLQTKQALILLILFLYSILFYNGLANESYMLQYHLIS
jgi:hypothetical protein